MYEERKRGEREESDVRRLLSSRGKELTQDERELEVISDIKVENYSI